MYTVRDVMTTKVQTLKLEDDLALAESMFREGRYQHLPVVEGAMLVGMVYAPDLEAALANPASKVVRTSPVRLVMRPGATCVRPMDSLERAMRLMLRHKLSCVAVVSEDGGQLVGLVTQSDVTRFGARMVHGLDVAERAILTNLLDVTDPEGDTALRPASD